MTPAGIRRAYRRHTARAGGSWCAHVTRAGPEGRPEVLVSDAADRVVQAYSVQKLAVAVAVLDQVDRGRLDLAQPLDLSADDILGGSGIYHLHGVWGDRITLANALTAMLLVSDNTAVRLCGRLLPPDRINEILAGMGLIHTRVEPAGDPYRFLLGTTTARETHDLCWRVATGDLLTPASRDLLLRVTRAAAGYTDGIRRDMSSVERGLVATKHAAEYDERGAARHEVGVMFDPVTARPRIAYAFFADALGDADNYGGTHPAVRAHAALGRLLRGGVGRRRAGWAGRVGP